MISRRSFLHCSLMAGGLVVVPRFGRWFQRVREPMVAFSSTSIEMDGHEGVVVVLSYRDQWGRPRREEYRCQTATGGIVIANGLVLPPGAHCAQIAVNVGHFGAGT